MILMLASFHACFMVAKRCVLKHGTHVSQTSHPIQSIWPSCLIVSMAMIAA